MFRNSRPVFTVLLILIIVAVGSPLEAKGVTKLSKAPRLSGELQLSTEVAPESPSEDTFLVQSWIPGFDDEEPEFICTPVSPPNLQATRSANHAHFEKMVDVAGCGLMLRMLPWNFHSVPMDYRDFFPPMI